jgi:hypothetical protein
VNYSPVSVGLPGVASGIGGGMSDSFASNFVTSSNASSYELPFPNFLVGATGAGDWNVRYGAVYYNINNSSLGGAGTAASWSSACANATGGCNNVTPAPAHFPFCAVELVVAGQYPNARYFSISNYDEHFTIAQHIADVDVDPASASQSSPFIGGNAWKDIPYLVPISLGQVPSATPGLNGPVQGCQISPYEEDNLLDATQRHPAGDWNTDIGTPGVNYPHQRRGLPIPCG